MEVGGGAPNQILLRAPKKLGPALLESDFFYQETKKENSVYKLCRSVFVYFMGP